MQTFIARKWMSWIGAAVLILSATYLAITLTPWSIGLCSEEQVAEAYSPDEKYLARAFVRNCGATTGYLTHVNLHPYWSWFNTEWVGTIRQGQVFANTCYSDVKLVWLSNSNLEIQYESCSKGLNDRRTVTMRENSWDEISITYRESVRSLGMDQSK